MIEVEIYKKVRTFEDLTCWKLARAFRIEIYRISKKFPPEEKYHLTAQIRDAAVSVTSNIAEGFGRYHYQENIQFCRISRGSVNEIIDQLYTALDAMYITNDTFQKLSQQGRDVGKSINGYITFLKDQLNK